MRGSVCFCLQITRTHVRTASPGDCTGQRNRGYRWLPRRRRPAAGRAMSESPEEPEADDRHCPRSSRKPRPSCRILASRVALRLREAGGATVSHKTIYRAVYSPTSAGIGLRARTVCDCAVADDGTATGPAQPVVTANSGTFKLFEQRPAAPPIATRSLACSTLCSADSLPGRPHRPSTITTRCADDLNSPWRAASGVGRREHCQGRHRRHPHDGRRRVWARPGRRVLRWAQHGWCQWRRRSGASVGTTTTWPTPRAISWLHPGQE